MKLNIIVYQTRQNLGLMYLKKLQQHKRYLVISAVLSESGFFIREYYVLYHRNDLNLAWL